MLSLFKTSAIVALPKQSHLLPHLDQKTIHYCELMNPIYPMLHNLLYWIQVLANFVVHMENPVQLESDLNQYLLKLLDYQLISTYFHVMNDQDFSI